MPAEAKAWLAELPEELQKDPVFQNFNTPADLASAYREARTVISRKGVIVPPEGTKEDSPEMAAFYEQLGRPKEAKDYEIAAGTIPDKLKQFVTQEDIDEFRAAAFGMGMSKTTFNKAFGYRIKKLEKEIAVATAKQTEQFQATESALRSKFGSKYNDVVGGVQKLINTYGGESAEKLLPLLNGNPDLIGLLAGVMGDMSEATLAKLGHTPGGELTPDEAKDEITRIRTSKDHPLNAAFNNPNLGQKHLDALKRVDVLYAMAYPGKKAI